MVEPPGRRALVAALRRSTAQAFRSLFRVCVCVGVLCAPASAESIGGAAMPGGDRQVESRSQALRFGDSVAPDALRIALPPTARSGSSEAGGPLQIGFGRDLPFEFRGDLADRLAWTELDDGAIVAAVTVTSPGAEALRAGLRARLGSGGEIRFFGGTGAAQRYPVTLTRREFSEPGSFGLVWSPTVDGDTIGMEVFLPSRAALSTFSLEVEKISHIFVGNDVLFDPSSRSSRSFHCPGPHVDVACSVASESTVNTAVGLRYTKSGNTYRCTGTLMNNSLRDNAPYLLTAWHCISAPAAALSAEFRWFFQRAFCGYATLDSRYVSTTGGANLLAMQAFCRGRFGIEAVRRCRVSGLDRCGMEAPQARMEIRVWTPPWMQAFCRGRFGIEAVRRCRVSGLDRCGMEAPQARMEIRVCGRPLGCKHFVAVGLGSKRSGAVVCPASIDAAWKRRRPVWRYVCVDAPLDASILSRSVWDRSGQALSCVRPR